MSGIRVMVVDDHTLFRRGLTALLAADGRFRVVGEAGDANEALRVAAACAPQVILLDNHLPGVNGVDALPGLAEAAPGVRILMLTMSEDERDLAAALRGGAAGYLLKTADAAELGSAIEQRLREPRAEETGTAGDEQSHGVLLLYQRAPKARRNSSIWASLSGAGLGTQPRHSLAVSSSSSSTALAASGLVCHTFGPSRSSITARIGAPRSRAAPIAAATRSATCGSPGRRYGISGTWPTFITK